MKAWLLVGALTLAATMSPAWAGIIVGTGTPELPLTNDGGGIYTATGSLNQTSYITPAQLNQAVQNMALDIKLYDPNNITVSRAINLAQGAEGPSLLLSSGGDLYVDASITLAALDPDNIVPTLTLEAADTIYIAAGVTFDTALPVVFDAPHVIYEGQPIPEPPVLPLLGIGVAAVALIRTARSCREVSRLGSVAWERRALFAA